MKFRDFEFHSQVQAGVRAMGYVDPTPIQAKALPLVLAGHDVMGLAQTGTGKTAAFVLPILQRLLTQPGQGVRALVLAPTRELAEQIHQAFQDLGGETGLRSVTVYGGVGIQPQIKALRRADIVVACPGRLLDHLGRLTVSLSHLEVLVLDEADQMFDMGFLPDIRRVLKHVPPTRQTLLFSATMPQAIRGLAQEVLSDPQTVQVGTTAPAETVQHALYPVAAARKTDLLLQLLETIPTESVLVFTRTKHRAKRLGKKLDTAGYRAASLQGNLSQTRRREAMDGFRDGTFQVLVATDIAARGIDVTRISHVINFDVPSTPEAYIHRIGRTGRATRSGEAFTLVTEDDTALVRAIRRAVGRPITEHRLPGFADPASAPTPTPTRSPSRAAGRAGSRRPSGGTARPSRRRPRSRSRSHAAARA